jgi:uncharacterized membrane protein
MDETMTSSRPETSKPAYRLVIVAFADEQGAGRALAQVLAARRAQRVAVPAAAEVRRDGAGAVTINEPGDIGAKEGAVAGGLVGGVLGLLLARRMLAGAAIGAALGAFGARKHDAGIPNWRLLEIGAELPAGSSALVAIVPEEAVAVLRSLPGAKRTSLTVEPIAFDLDFARQWSEGQYAAAAGSLATQVESLIGEAKARLAEAAESFGKEGAGAPPGDESGGSEQHGSGGTATADAPGVEA